MFLNNAHIRNYLSLRDVTFPLRNLTVLVGPNASGKSNVLSALNILNAMMSAENPPPPEIIQESLWSKKANNIIFELQAMVETTSAAYKLELSDRAENPFVAEELLLTGIEDVQAISIKNGEGIVKDEDGNIETNYKSNKLALKSAGDYGNKPVTRSLTEFIKKWEFFNFDTDFIRTGLTRFSPTKKEIHISPKLDKYGSQLPEVLWDWQKNHIESFHNVSNSLALSMNFEIDYCVIDGQNLLCLLEGYDNPIPLHNASDGTLRLLAYNILLNEPELPPLIAIEEPEQNLHPGALSEIANVLEQIAQHSQVIITTHSSQLLDVFDPESLSDSLGVLLLQNRPGFGTVVYNLEDYRGEREALQGWIDDFGIGSAIFDSELLQDVMEDTSQCQA